MRTSAGVPSGTSGGGGTVGSGWIGFSVAEWPDAVRPSYLCPDAGMHPYLYQAQPEHQGRASISTPATGSPKGPCRGYVIDHIVPIA